MKLPISSRESMLKGLVNWQVRRTGSRTWIYRLPKLHIADVITPLHENMFSLLLRFFLAPMPSHIRGAHSKSCPPRWTRRPAASEPKQPCRAKERVRPTHPDFS